MTGLRYLVLRELLDQLRTFRFGVMFLLIQTIALISVYLAVQQDRQDRALYEQVQSENRSELGTRLGEARGKIMEAFRGSTRLCRAPAILPFVAGAGNRTLPNLFMVSAFRTQGPEYLRSPNPALGYAEAIDWGFIAAIVLSLTALVLTFDAISREREEKTFQMVMGHSVRRSTVIVGKALGAFLPILAAWCLAVVLQFVVWNLLAKAPLSGQEWVLALLSGVPIVCLVAFFVLLGILISLLFHTTGACGTVAALCWAFFVLVVPNAGQLLANHLEGLPDPKAAEARAKETRLQVGLAYCREHGIDWNNGIWYPPDPLGFHLALAEPADKEWRLVRDQWKVQARLARQLSRISPVATMRYALEELTGQGYAGYEAFERQAEGYHREMLSTLLSIYPLDLDASIEGEAAKRLDAVPLTPEVFPAPSPGIASVSERLVDATPDLALLALFAGLALVATLATANHQSVTG